MTPEGTVISQSDLISLSIPAMSLSLAVTANLVACFRNRPQAPPSGHETEVQFSTNRGDQYYTDFCQKRSNMSHSSTSRPRILDSSRSEMGAEDYTNEDDPRSPPSGRETEARPSMNRSDRYHASSAQQRSSTSYPSTSLPPLYHYLRTPSGNGRSELAAA